MNKSEDEEKYQSNIIPKLVIKMEHFYDIDDKFKKLTNCKMYGSSMKYDSVNLGTEKEPKNVNLGLGCSPQEKVMFVKLFKEYKDVFAWTYGNLKTFDIGIMQHVIPLEKDVNPYQRKLRKMHPSLEPLVKKELNKMPDAKIIFLIRHTHWIANLVPIRKKMETSDYVSISGTQIKHRRRITIMSLLCNTFFNAFLGLKVYPYWMGFQDIIKCWCRMEINLIKPSTLNGAPTHIIKCRLDLLI